MILFIDTTEKIAKIGLVGSKIVEFEGGRELDSLILTKIDAVLKEANISSLRGAKGDAAISGIIANAGPGSYTGLRIGLSVANALGYGLNISVVGVANEKDEQKIIEKGFLELKGKNGFGKPVVAEYGGEPNITKPKGK